MMYNTQCHCKYEYHNCFLYLLLPTHKVNTVLFMCSTSVLILFKDLFCTSLRAHYFSIASTIWLMLFVVIMAVNSKLHN
jgi:hypothetical protein